MVGSTSLAVKSFIPSHMTCVKGVVREVDSSADSSEVLDQFADLGAEEDYRCSVMKEATEFLLSRVLSLSQIFTVRQRLRCGP